MPGPMDSRAVVFPRSPQPVEVLQAGAWWAGELLGWRHDASGTCQMQVRVVVGGVEETAWIDLAALRLPEQAPTSAPEPGRLDPRDTQVLPPASVVSALRGRATGRRRAPDETPEEALQDVPSGEATVPPAAAVEVAARAGRHRAPDDGGRHRAADTGVFASVSAAVPDATSQMPTVPARPVVEPHRAAPPDVGVVRPVPSARVVGPDGSRGRADVCAGRVDPEPDHRTRLLRVADLASGPRRPRGSGSRPV